MDRPPRVTGQPHYLSSRIHYLTRDFVHPSIDYENELMAAIRFGDEIKALETMRKINEMDGAVLADYPLRSKKNALIASCTLFTRAIIKGGVDPETAFQLSDTLILEIEKVETLERLVQFEYEMLLLFIAVVKREKETMSYSHIVNMSIYYIREHIFQDFALQSIASHVGVNPSYLSDRFKRETGISMTTFINHRKIEESKHFLTYTNQAISEIAFLFKFCSQSYYTQLFKKFTGQTPKQFRSQGAAELS